MITAPYVEQVRNWPREGRHILADFDHESIVVYQAYRAEIARHAVEHGSLGGDAFSYARMSWIKPNFLWMMYRSGWGTKGDQQITLALRISRKFFDALLGQAVLSIFDPDKHESRDTWQTSLARSDVRLQWDPDHDPKGMKQARRALQLGLRGRMLECFGKHELMEVRNISEFVAAQRPTLTGDLGSLHVPIERVYAPADRSVAMSIGLS